MMRDDDMAHMASMGRGGDSEIGHLSVDELIVPPRVLQSNPQLVQALLQGFEEAGLDIGQYLVGGGDDSMNPETMMPEFFDPDGPGEGPEGAAGTAGGGMGPAGDNTGRDADAADRNAFGGGVGPAGENPGDPAFGGGAVPGGIATGNNPFGNAAVGMMGPVFGSPIDAMGVMGRALMGEDISGVKPGVVNALEAANRMMAGVGVKASPGNPIGGPEMIRRA